MHFMGPRERTTALILACEGFKVRCSGSFLHAARPNAGRANSNMLRRAVYQRVHALQVRIPTSPSRIVRVTDYVSKVRPFAA
jgi:metal-dependent amidase/aminoacylase/carboxypeptidase family protein